MFLCSLRFVGFVASRGTYKTHRGTAISRATPTTSYGKRGIVVPATRRRPRRARWTAATASQCHRGRFAAADRVAAASRQWAPPSQGYFASYSGTRGSLYPPGDQLLGRYGVDALSVIPAAAAAPAAIPGEQSTAGARAHVKESRREVGHSSGHLHQGKPIICTYRLLASRLKELKTREFH